MQSDQSLSMCRLADVCSDVSYGYTESAVSTPVGPRFLRITDIQGGRFDWEDVPYCPASPEAIEKYRLDVGDIVIARTGNSTGENAQVWSLDGPAIFASYLIRFRVDPKKANPFFVGYQLRTQQFRNYVQGVRGGSAQPGANARQLGGFPLLLVKRELQDFAVDVLSVIDRRIDLLRQTSITLESIAQAVFKSWFVDFDHVLANAEGREPEDVDPATERFFPSELVGSSLGPIPKGWRVSEVGKVAECVGGGTPSTKRPEYWEPAIHSWATPKDLSGLNTPVLLRTARSLSDAGLARVSSGLLPKGTLLMSSRAPIGYLALAQVPLAVNQGFIAMKPGGELTPEYLYFWCSHNMDAIKQKANGSTFMEISKSAFRPIPLVVPSSHVVQSFQSFASAIFRRIAANEQERNVLSELRDTLIPRLVSGKLRLPQAEHLSEASPSELQNLCSDVS